MDGWNIANQHQPIGELMFGINFGRPQEPLAALKNADKLLARGRTKAAIKAYQRLVGSENLNVAAKAGYKLGILRRNQGDYSQAVDVLCDVADSGHHDMGPVAAFSLAGMLSNLGPFSEAVRRYKQVAGSDHRIAPSAMLCLAELLLERGQCDAAVSYLKKAVNTGDDDIAPKALVDLGDIRRKDGDIKGAAKLYQRAVSSGHAEAGPLARQLLRELGLKPPVRD